uniref:PMS1 homolog 1, mismatch repair system component n=1 Tax=Anolis carolinensis TaxID=28377 RepID=A0A803TIZ9_ANOCA
MIYNSLLEFIEKSRKVNWEVVREDCIYSVLKFGMFFCFRFDPEIFEMKQLPAETVRILSSSQVITSVVSVVKELIENSLDANATNVDVKLENYGFDKIEVRDNGDGIRAADVPVMAVKHYTSKISSSQDLESLTSYGFRGEALASICSTSEVLITTKTANEDFSTQYALDRSGHIISQKPSHLGQGTTVTVLKLFKNLPVRKQFYSTDKKCKEEMKKIQKLLMAYGIIKPELRIMFTHNKTVMWQKTRALDHKTAFMAVVGAAIMDNMVSFQRHCKDIELVQQYYKLKFQMDSNRSYPVFLINIIIPPSAVDVNLTPDKSQVLLHNQESICLAIDDILTSLYGPLTEVDSCPTEKTDTILEDSFINEAEQTTMCANQIGSCRNTKQQARMPLFSSRSNGKNSGREKYPELHLNNQTLCNDTSQGLTSEVDTSSSKRIGYDIFQGATVELCEDQQNKSKGLFSPDNNIFMDTNFETSIEGDLMNDHFQEPDKTEEPIMPKESSEITADQWSLGNALRNSRGENLEPVQILIPGGGGGGGGGRRGGGGGGVKPQEKNDGETQQNLHKENNNQTIKRTNVVNEKVGQITAYDIISNQIIKKPMTAFALFTQEHRSGLSTENTKASAEELTLKMEEMWKALNKEEKKKYEEKAARDLDRYKKQSRKAMDQSTKRLSTDKEKKHKARLKDCLSNQPKLDKLFHSQMEKKHSSCQAIKIVKVPFSMDSFRRKLHILGQKESDKDEPCLIHLLNFPDAWIMASEKKIMMLNPYRIEEALLFKKLLESHKLPIEKLDKPVVLTDSLLRESQYMDVLCKMPKESVRFDGSSYLLDSRLIANGFKIKIIPGSEASENQLEIEGMANCVPYYGISDLKEILNAVINDNAKEVYECRPLKVVNYLEGEAVRLSRQLPLYLSKEDVQDTVYRMKQQLGNQDKSCVHGRLLVHCLTDIPQSE